MSGVRVAFEVPSIFHRVTPGLIPEQARAEVTARAQARGAALPDERAFG